jgi:hypothetical protein
MSVLCFCNLIFITLSLFYFPYYDIVIFPYHSIALVVDSPQFFNRLAESFISRINARFIVLLWGEKSCLNSEVVNGIPLYDFKDITQLGRESRNTLRHSHEQGIV